MKINETQLRKIISEAILKEFNDYDLFPKKMPRPGFDTLYTMKWDYRFIRGAFDGKTVKDVYEYGTRGKDYIAWVYYNREFIDFSEDIKEALKLIPIEKPGTCPEKIDEWRKIFFADNWEEYESNRNKGIRHWNYVSGKIHSAKKFYKDMSGLNRDKKIGSKAALAWKNQGH